MKCIKSETKRKISFTQIQIELEDVLVNTKLSISAQPERNEALEKKPMRVKTDLDKYLKWTWSSKAFSSANNRLRAGELVKLQSTPGEGPSEQAKPSDQAGQDSSVEMNLSGQEPGTPLGTSRNDSQWDLETNNSNHSQKEDHNDEETLDTTTPISQQRQDSSVPWVSNCMHAWWQNQRVRLQIDRTHIKATAQANPMRDLVSRTS
ncbi:hypothetical protein HAX54_049558 [Datura stramonium]|uniref:Uncharacterized protein n=1 Tax=Datura stramonium TaxID=4076 RepID=A0ABS8SVN8_DATST|nr:hypothetical protein [Datura stramonium]